MDILRIGTLGVAGALLAIQFKNVKAEYGIYISVALSMIIFFSILDQLKGMIASVKTIAGFIQMDNYYIGTLMKMLGITYVAEFASGICKDAGYQTIAVQIETFGKLTILALSMPVLMALLNTIRDFMV
ncbi:stage III sporulation AC/AD family protein [Faecalicatena contorta]|uniref:stage III sporulation AC/AD family protein n=1 Tax=Faecalicatena contorta TaxID=39482 RepID=UPI001F3724EF|nr:stage III sporulation AC/AD family protein [Faecalicatena contorta]MCF2682846.1 stage III sporulation protein AD [Faecalicatena contorta]